VALSAAQPAPAPLALSGNEAWGETDLKGVFQKGVARPDQGEKRGPMPMAMAIEKPVTGSEGKATRVVVVGDGDFFTNKYMQLGANRDFVMNAISWLAEQEDRITIRPRAREGSIVYLTNEQATTLKFFAVDLLPVALLGLGLAVWMVRRSR
jgi:ABC-type uncharacterized transport system involved in gliding motility auxiliary subunit